jgi:hypothetical protein
MITDPVQAGSILTNGRQISGEGFATVPGLGPLAGTDNLPYFSES